jgi:hypothetical protein
VLPVLSAAYRSWETPAFRTTFVDYALGVRPSRNVASTTATFKAPRLVDAAVAVLAWRKARSGTALLRKVTSNVRR